MPKNSDELPGFDGVVCRGARAMLGMSQQELCDAAGCGRKLLNDFENGLLTPKLSKRSDIKKALEQAGAVFSRSDDLAMVGVRAGFASRRSARSRAFADEGNGMD